MAKKDKALRKKPKREKVRAGGIPVIIFKNGRKRFIKTTN